MGAFSFHISSVAVELRQWSHHPNRARAEVPNYDSTLTMLCLRNKISIWYIFAERFMPLLCFTLTLMPTWWENVGLSCWISTDLLDSIWSSPVMAQWTNAFYIMHHCLKRVNYISQELLHLLYQVSVDEIANYSEFRKKFLLLLQQCASYHWISTFCFMIWTFCSQYTTVVCTHNTHREQVYGPALIHIRWALLPVNWVRHLSYGVSMRRCNHEVVSFQRPWSIHCQ